MTGIQAGVNSPDVERASTHKGTLPLSLGLLSRNFSVTTATPVVRPDFQQAQSWEGWGTLWGVVELQASAAAVCTAHAEELDGVRESKSVRHAKLGVQTRALRGH